MVAAESGGPLVAGAGEPITRWGSPTTGIAEIPRTGGNAGLVDIRFGRGETSGLADGTPGTRAPSKAKEGHPDAPFCTIIARAKVSVKAPR